ncbi:MAG: DUF305 domain-containing protein [Pyrinomonadaceae bacterium]
MPDKQISTLSFTFAALRLLAVLTLTFLISLTTLAQESVIVQPGAPGQASKVLPASTRAVLPPFSTKDIEFMQGMIMHHAQAVEMTALIEARTDNKELRLLGARISQSQSDEINFMRRWLVARGEPTEMEMDDMAGMNHGSGSHLMPGMLSRKQMAELRRAKGRDFDKLFLAGMIQHHEGALIMVKQLFDAVGAAQDTEVYGFTTDVDTGQRAEIRIMQVMLERIKIEEK